MNNVKIGMDMISLKGKKKPASSGKPISTLDNNNDYL